MFEFGYRADFVVLVFGNCLVAAVVDNFLEYECLTIGWETVMYVQILQSRVNNAQVLWPHMLSSIHTERSDKNAR